MTELFLTHFDLKEELIIASDVGIVGIGSVFLQKDKLGSIKIVVHASRRLIMAEKYYNQIKKVFVHKIWN